MSPRMGAAIEAAGEEEKPCFKFLRLLWKFCRCVFSHVTLVSLVVAYCVLGAFAFESLEAKHEKMIKGSIKLIRGNVTEKLWKITTEAEVLIQGNWTAKVRDELQLFETELLRKMKKEGWDGNEKETDIQWTFAGALFYSIIVITTIGYGHIAPKTRNGKVVTIFYAILGIPLMLLCLSNIGDVMASSFRFLYWKVCCYICTKPPKKRRPRSTLGRSYSVRQPGRYASARVPVGLRRSIRVSDKSADSALCLSETMTRSSYSDTDCRYQPRRYDDHRRATGYPPASSTMTRYSDVPVPSPRMARGPSRLTTQSLDRKLLAAAQGDAVLCNKYALERADEAEIGRTKWSSSSDGKKTSTRLQDNQAEVTRPPPRRCLSVEDARTNPSTGSGRHAPSVFLEMDPVRRLPATRTRRRSNFYPARPYRREAPSPRIMSPMGFAVHRQVYADDYDFDYDYYPSNEAQERSEVKPVPIWLCVFLVVSYILGGAYLFMQWEKWDFLDSAYFCFITLTTIGFGDFVPAHRLHAEQGIALCSLYLLFGIALLAMSFNLVQEEVINSVKGVAKRLGIIKESDDDEDDEDDDEEYEIEYDEHEGNMMHELDETEPI